jgi:hypothetical protein
MPSNRWRSRQVPPRWPGRDQRRDRVWSWSRRAQGRRALRPIRHRTTFGRCRGGRRAIAGRAVALVALRQTRPGPTTRGRGGDVVQQPRTVRVERTVATIAASSRSASCRLPHTAPLNRWGLIRWATRGHRGQRTKTRRPGIEILSRAVQSGRRTHRADDGIRTRDPHLGKKGDVSGPPRPPHYVEQPLPHLFVRPVRRVGSSPETYV